MERKPHTCPVCSGKGTVPNGFYSKMGTQTTNAAEEPCKSCVNGIIWESDLMHPEGKSYGCPVCFEWYDGKHCESCTSIAN